MAARLEVHPFDGKSDFGIWSIKMKALLSHHKVLIALQEKEEKWSDQQKKKKEDIMEEAYNLLVLNLSDQVLRKVSKETTFISLWQRLVSLYSNQQAPNLAYLKAACFAYKMDSAKSVDDNLDDFLKMTLQLVDTEHALDDKSVVMILMNAMPESFQPVKNAFQYTGVLPVYDTLCTAMRTREIEIKHNKAKSNASLFVKNKTNNKGQGNKPKSSGEGNGNDKGKSDKDKGNKGAKDNKGQKETRKCYYCGKPGHLRKDCYTLKNKRKENETNIASNDKTEGGEVLNVIDSKIMHVNGNALAVCDISVRDQWVLDSGCSFHMSPNKSWFEDYKCVSHEEVYMGNNNACAILGIGNVKLRMSNEKMCLRSLLLLPITQK